MLRDQRLFHGILHLLLLEGRLAEDSEAAQAQISAGAAITHSQQAAIGTIIDRMKEVAA